MSTTMSRSVDAEIKRVTVTLPRRQLDALQPREGAEIPVAKRVQHAKARG